MRSLVVTALAQADILAAADWYREQEPKLVPSFLEHLRMLLGRVTRMPMIYQARLRTIRMARMRRFPYCLYFTADAERIVVVALLHEKRDPSAWRERA